MEGEKPDYSIEKVTEKKPFCNFLWREMEEIGVFR